MKEYSLSDLNRRPGELADQALIEPLLLKKHKRPQLVMMSAAHYAKVMGVSLEDLIDPPGATIEQPRRRSLAGLKGTSTIDDGE